MAAVPQGSRRMSTNEKLAEFLNTTDILEEEAEILDADEIKAKIRLRTTALYGAGARFQVPKVKKKTNTTQSPFVLSKPIEQLNPVQESSSVPPGAHEDQFRRIRFPTQKSMSDPDRVFFTTTSMTEGIRCIEQPPWYYGYQNKTKPSDSSIVMAANRYGYRGSKEIKQFHTLPVSPPAQTMNEHIPSFLQPQTFVDEWVPAVVGNPLNKGYALSTPKLWPENSEYPNGYKLKDLPSSTYYNRETTTGTIDRPHTSPYLQMTMSQPVSDHSRLLENSQLESRNKLESRPQSAISNFRATWNNRVAQNANATLRQTMARETPVYEAHTLSDPQDEMRYSGSTAMIVHSMSAEGVKFKMHMENSSVGIPFDLRWKTVITTYKTIRSRLTRDQTTDQVISIFAEALRIESYAHGQKAALLRMQFIKVMGGIFAFEHLSTKQHSLLFSVFDPLKKSFVIYANIICALVVLDQPMKYKDNICKLIIELWRVYEKYGDDQQSVDIAEAILLSCSGTDSEYNQIKKLFKTEVRPVLYNLAVSRKEDTFTQSLSHKTNNNSTGANSNMKLDTYGKTIQKTKKKHLVIQPVYNIYDSVFDESLFNSLLAQCPLIVAEFGRQYTARLTQCYGKDPRDVAEETVAEEVTQKDFSWILKKKKK